jgi:hypothetical protein
MLFPPPPSSRSRGALSLLVLVRRLTNVFIVGAVVVNEDGVHL